MDARSHGACDRGGWGCAAAEPWGNRKRTGMRRALLVDDSPVLRSTVAQSLEDAGWSASIASDAVEGLIAALAAPPDAVVNDLWMPVFSGLQLCQLLRGAAHDGANPRTSLPRQRRPSRAGNRVEVADEASGGVIPS